MRSIRTLAAVSLFLFASAGSQAASPAAYPAQLYGDDIMPGANVMDVADFNGDAIPDVAVAHGALGLPGLPQGVNIYIGRAGGGYVEPVFYEVGPGPFRIAAGDLNSDGWIDLVTANEPSSEAVSVLMNEGDGTFATHVDYSVESLDPDETVALRDLVLADATGNGHPDLVIGTDTPEAYVIPGHSDGTFGVSAARSVSTYLPLAQEVLVADIDSNGRPDLLVTTCSHVPDRVYVFLDGEFEDPASQVVYLGHCPRSTAADVDGNGYPDVILADKDVDGEVHVLLNNGDALSDSGAAYKLPEPSRARAVKTADIDGDGAVDILVPNRGNDLLTILHGNGDGSFEDPVGVPLGYSIVNVSTADINGDGKLDLVGLRSHGGSDVLTARNLGERKFWTYRNFTHEDASGNGNFAVDMASADFNGDGQPDVVTANEEDGTVSVLLNESAGDFAGPTVLGPGLHSFEAVVTGDVDDDGAADIVSANGDDGIYTWLGKGDGTFPPAVNSPDVGTTGDVRGLALGDLDGDGTPELAVTRNASYYATADAVNLCSGDGSGGWTCGSGILVDRPRRVALADLDGDGNLDLVVTTAIVSTSVVDAYDAYVYFGKGDGNFAATPDATLPVAGDGWGIAIGDLNGDAVPDLVFGSTDVDISVFIGKGGGTFGAAAVYASGVPGGADSRPYFVALADVDGDGAPGIVAANNNSDESSVSIFTNKGDGTFDKPVNHAAGFEVYPLLTLDVDGDGLDDIVSATYGSGRSRVNVYLHNHAPVVVNGEPLVLAQDTSGAGRLTASDSEGDPVTFAAAVPPAHGDVSLDAVSGEYVYTPVTGFSGSDSFSATASDGGNTSLPVEVPITVESVTPPDGDANDDESDGSGSDDSGSDDSGSDDSGSDDGGSDNVPDDDSGGNPPVDEPSLDDSGGGGGLGGFALVTLGLFAVIRRRRA